MKIEEIIKLWKLNIQIRKILTKNLKITRKNRFLLKIKIIINYDLIYSNTYFNLLFGIIIKVFKYNKNNNNNFN